MFLMGAAGLAVFMMIVTMLLMNWLSAKKPKRFSKMVSFLLSVVALCGLAAALTTGYTFVKSKQKGYKVTQTVKIDGQEIKTDANADERLFLPMAYQTIEATHPSVVNFPKEWHGYKYWMGITAYPKGDATKENPHILASNDLLQWEVPQGLTNPLDEPQSAEFEDNQRPKQYDSDTHLIYNPTTENLELFWRYVDDVAKTFTIFHRTSKDGVTWTQTEIAYQADRTKQDWLSPAFMWEDNRYKVWYVNRDFSIQYRESEDGKTWSEPREVTIPYAEKNDKMHHWHIDVQKFDDQYEILVVGFEQKGEKPALSERHIMNLYHASSKDNQTWSALTPIIYPSQKKDHWDGKGIYRSAFIKENGTYYVFYSGIGFNDVRGVGVSYGADINQLKGVDFSNTADFHKH